MISPGHDVDCYDFLATFGRIEFRNVQFGFRNVQYLYSIVNLNESFRPFLFDTQKRSILAHLP